MDINFGSKNQYLLISNSPINKLIVEGKKESNQIPRERMTNNDDNSYEDSYDSEEDDDKRYQEYVLTFWRRSLILSIQLRCWRMTVGGYQQFIFDGAVLPH